MSTKAILWLAVAIVVLLGGWYLWVLFSGGQSPAPSGGTTATQEATTTQATSQSQTAGPSLGSGSSDAQLSADLGQLDSSVNASADASQSAQTFTDQPVQQSY